MSELLTKDGVESRRTSILLGLSGDHRKVILREVCDQAALLAEMQAIIDETPVGEQGCGGPVASWELFLTIARERLEEK